MAFFSTIANWIWLMGDDYPNSWVCFRKSFYISESGPLLAKAWVAAETKYYLFCNGQLAVFEGSLNRGPYAGCGYIDSIDLSAYLCAGENCIAVLCWYWGNEGRNNIDCGHPGFLFDCEIGGRKIVSDTTWKVLKHPAFHNTGDPQPSFLYGGHNIGFDAAKDIGVFMDTAFDDIHWDNAECFGVPPCAPWGALFPRPIPQFQTGKLQNYRNIRITGNTYHCELPYASHITPFFQVRASAGKRIDIRTDRYEVHGGPGDEHNIYRGHRVSYLTKDGVQKFEALNWLPGETVLYTLEDGIEVQSLMFRESGYATDFAGDFSCDDIQINRLVEKCKRTLYFCMRDNFMDCPDRERGQWIGDVSIQTPQAFYVFDDRATMLVKKAIKDFINLRNGDVLVGNVPGVNWQELPGQSLLAVGPFGLIEQYYRFSGDTDLLADCLEPIARYLLLWEMAPTGLVVPRPGGWRWFDHNANVDSAILENCLYYLGLVEALQISDLTNNHKYDTFLRERMQCIKTNFEDAFWQGRYYASQPQPDERANALAVLSGLADSQHYSDIKNVLTTVKEASPYMEYFVLEALLQMEEHQAALERMRSRYLTLIDNANSTLWEDFTILGTKNHAWSGGPLAILFRHFAGITMQSGHVLHLRPSLTSFRQVSAHMHTRFGEFRMDFSRQGQSVILRITRPASLTVLYDLIPARLGVDNKQNIILQENTW